MLKRYKRKKIYTSYCFEAVRDEVRWPNGQRLKRDLLIHPGISVMIPLLDPERVVLVRQYRYGAGKPLWEIPAGTLEKRESALACAKRELEEEIGYRAARWKKLTTVYASPGFSTEKIHCFLATGLRKTMASPEDDEVLEVKVFTLGRIKSMIRSKLIRDAKSLIPLFYYLSSRGRS